MMARRCVRRTAARYIPLPPPDIETKPGKASHIFIRDSEVNWEYVRCLPDGECVSVDGTHLGHNLPDGSGNRYCINLVSVAGYPTDGA